MEPYPKPQHLSSTVERTKAVPKERPLVRLKEGSIASVRSYPFACPLEEAPLGFPRRVTVIPRLSTAHAYVASCSPTMKNLLSLGLVALLGVNSYGDDAP